jgi:hypothetical protein
MTPDLGATSRHRPLRYSEHFTSFAHCQTDNSPFPSMKFTEMSVAVFVTRVNAEQASKLIIQELTYL